MANRPCKPGADLKRMWQVLLPGAPFPDCAAPRTKAENAADDIDQAADTAAAAHRLKETQPD